MNEAQMNMEITLAFRLRSLGHRAGTRPVHAV